MAELKLFTPEQLAERSKPKRQQNREAKERMIAQYTTALAGAKPGSGGEINLGESDEKRKIRALLKEAAARIKITLKFRPIKDATRIEFSVAETARRKKAAPQTSDTPAPGPKKAAPKGSKKPAAKKKA